MKCKTVCPSCGEIYRTSSIGSFRHCGSQYSVKENLLAGETPKYEKMVAKYAAMDAAEGKVPKEKVVKPEAEPSEEQRKIEKKIQEKVNEKPTTPKVEPIIEEKPPAEKKVVERPVSEKKSRKPREKPAPKPEIGENFGFF